MTPEWLVVLWTASLAAVFIALDIATELWTLALVLALVVGCRALVKIPSPEETPGQRQEVLDRWL